MGSVVQVHKSKERKIVISSYAFLEDKTDSCTNVIQGALSLADNFETYVQLPQTVISDFKLAIFNSVKTDF